MVVCMAEAFLSRVSIVFPCLHAGQNPASRDLETKDLEGLRGAGRGLDEGELSTVGRGGVRPLELNPLQRVLRKTPDR